MRVGLWGARADAGGLAAMTYEFARHIRPDRTMVIDMLARGRGPCHPERYEWGDVEVNRGYNDAISVDTVRRFAGGLDVIYAAETAYREDAFALMRQMGAATVLHVMPELWRPKDAQPDAVWAPTSWMVDELVKVDRLPACTGIVPVPVPTDTFAPVPANRAEAARGSLLHPAAPAFHDRNGTDLVNEMLRWMVSRTRVVYADATGRQVPPLCRVGRGGQRIETDFVTGTSYDRRDAYPKDCGGLLLPRRYAGLSLPMQEAAALGWPIITLDLAPQNEWAHPGLLVEPLEGVEAKMVNGPMHVYRCKAQHLAAAVDALYDSRDLWAEARQVSLDFAESISWQRWGSRYRELLDDVASRGPTG